MAGDRNNDKGRDEDMDNDTGRDIGWGKGKARTLVGTRTWTGT